MRRRCREDGLGLAERRVGFLVTLQETWDGGRADWNVPTDGHVPMAQLARYDLDLLFGRGILDPQQIFGQLCVKAAMDLRDGLGGGRAALHPAIVDPLLDG